MEWSESAPTSCQSSEVLDQHRIGRFRAAREGQPTVAGPVEPENLVRSEMRHGLWRAARHGLFPDVIHAIYTVDERDGATIGGPNKGTAGCDGQRENLGGLAARERDHR